MTTIETGIQPPSSYPSAQWINDDQDYFHVPAQLRQWYADPAAAPSKHQRQRLRQNESMPGGGPVRVDQIVTDSTGRHVKAAPIQLHQTAARGLLGPYRPAMVQVDPDADPGSMPLLVWEHDIRLEAAQRAAKIDATIEDYHQANLARACRMCHTANPQPVGLPGPVNLSTGWGSYAGHQYCGQCLPAIQLAAAERHRERYRQEIDQLLDDQPEWSPSPPQRMETQVSQRW